jgi:hypothetical protein
MLLAWFTQLDQRELVEHGSGLVEVILIAALLFVVALPVVVLRALLHRRPLKGAMDGAGHFAAKASIALFVGLPLCAIVLAVPFGLLNLIGTVAFGRQFYWPLIVPGLAVVYGLGAAFAVWVIRAEKRRDETRLQKRKHERRGG